MNLVTFGVLPLDPPNLNPLPPNVAAHPRQYSTPKATCNIHVDLHLGLNVALGCTKRHYSRLWILNVAGVGIRMGGGPQVSWVMG